MAKRYRPVDRDQPFLLPPDMREWLPAEHPVWLVIQVVSDHLDTSAFHAERRLGGAGRAGYDPDMLLTLLIWGWARGVRSSRRIERCCSEDITFRVICAGDVPDHVTIHRFQAGFAEAVTSLFTEVLVLCARLGMGRLETVALDGKKITANAAKAANHDLQGLRRRAAEYAAQAAAEHAATDAAEDARFGPDRHGDELPDLPDTSATGSGGSGSGGSGGGGGGRRRDQRLGERIAAALPDLLAESEAAEQAAAEQAARQVAGQVAERRQDRPPRGRVPDEAAVQVAELELAAAVAAQQAKIEAQQLRRDAAAAQGRRLRERACLPPHEHHTVRTWQARLRKALARHAARHAARQDRETDHTQARRVRNLTDPDSRLMPVRGGGWIQGYNGQAVTAADLLVIAADLNNNPADVITYQQMMAAACQAAQLIRHHQPPPDTTDTTDTTDSGDTTDGGDTSGGNTSGDTSGIGVFLADAGYLSEDNLTAPGPDRLIALGKARDTEHAARTQPTHGPPPADADPITAMAHRLRTPEGISTYRHRAHIAETPFGHTTHNLGFTHLRGRGLAAAKAEWLFNWAVHNMTIALSSGHLTPARLAALTT